MYAVAELKRKAIFAFVQPFQAGTNPVRANRYYSASYKKHKAFLYFDAVIPEGTKAQYLQTGSEPVQLKRTTHNFYLKRAFITIEHGF